ncbi:MAG: WbqC family protein [Chitinophagales bacterium]|nr:WbqC family protein [Chitinophagales bacterium]
MRGTSEIITEMQYLPPVSRVALLQCYSKIIIDTQEPFRKSTWRNRCMIIGVNGPILLTVPVDGGRSVKKLSKDVRITYREKWQRNHWRSISSAYRGSSYFAFYEDKFCPFYEKKFEFLLDLNFELMELCIDLLHLDSIFSIDNNSETVEGHIDHINDVEKRNSNYQYQQVFEDRHGFIAGASVIDLLFNLGPEAKNHLIRLSLSHKNPP